MAGEFLNGVSLQTPEHQIQYLLKMLKHNPYDKLALANLRSQVRELKSVRGTLKTYNQIEYECRKLDLPVYYLKEAYAKVQKPVFFAWFNPQAFAK